MYNSYFGFSESPFSIAPDPHYLYLSEQHKEALAHLIYGVGDQGGFIVLTGEVGTGKTTICRSLLQQIPDNVDVAFLVNPKQSINQLLQSLFKELGIPFKLGTPSKELIDKLNAYLLQAHANGRNTILIIDEAQNLSVDVLEQLRLLTNLETNEKKLLQLVLIGQPEFNNLLALPELRQLSQRVTARFHLQPLPPKEITSYIEHRLKVADSTAKLFKASAIKKIYRYSGGVPRVINLLCDRALLGLYAINGKSVTARMINQSAKEVLPNKKAMAKHSKFTETYDCEQQSSQLTTLFTHAKLFSVTSVLALSVVVSYYYYPLQLNKNRLSLSLANHADTIEDAADKRLDSNGMIAVSMSNNDKLKVKQLFKLEDEERQHITQKINENKHFLSNTIKIESVATAKSLINSRSGLLAGQFINIPSLSSQTIQAINNQQQLQKIINKVEISVVEKQQLKPLLAKLNALPEALASANGR